MPAKLERCKEEVMKQGYTEQQAYAICNASINKDGCKQLKDKSFPALDKFIDETTGFLHVKGVLARTGVQEYLGSEISPDLEPDKIYGVFRHPEDVLSEESIKGYTNAPVTDDHPNDFVTSDNYKELMKGSCSEIVQDKKDGIDYVKGHLAIMDTDLINKLKDGKLEISAGYYSTLEEEEGEHLGVPYQFRQKDIKINHVAIVSRGRCGNSCRVINDYATITNETNNKGTQMAIIKIGETEYEVPEEVAAEFAKLIEAKGNQEEEMKTMSEDMEEVEKEKEQAVATADELKEQLRAVKRTTKDSAVAATAAKLVKVMQVADAMGVKVELTDELSMKKAVLTAKYPTIALDGKSADYVSARFDAMVESRDAAKKSHDNIANETKDGKAPTKLTDSIKDEEY